MSVLFFDVPVTLRIGCKVNLYLFLTGIRSTGWHELDSLFVPLPAPYDTITLSAGPTSASFTKGAKGAEGAERAELVVSCDTPGIDLKCNTLTQAYTAFYATTGFGPSLAARLEKGIPHGAGLGGGSADAAVLLRWLNDAATRCGKGLAEGELHALATGVGADVPFFLRNTPCVATGIGDELHPCEPPLLGSGVWLVLVCPPEEVSTPWAYRTFDTAVAAGSQQTFLTARQAQAISLVSVCAESPGSVLVNDFEPVVSARHPRIRACKELLLRAGAQAAVMSGSGASLVGLFRNEVQAHEGAHACETLFAETQTWIHCLNKE